MPFTIHLPEEIEDRLRRWAELSNQPEEEIVLRALESYLAIPPDLNEELEAWQQLGGEAIETVAPSANETDVNVRDKSCVARLEQARGMWQDRDDLPGLEVLRDELDRDETV